jgi:hypothetical protein
MSVHGIHFHVIHKNVWSRDTKGTDICPRGPTGALESLHFKLVFYPLASILYHLYLSFTLLYYFVFTEIFWRYSRPLAFRHCAARHLFSTNLDIDRIRFMLREGSLTREGEGIVIKYSYSYIITLLSISFTHFLLFSKCVRLIEKHIFY